MKKRTIISLLLVACMATMCFVGGTFAKYISTASGSDTARVAKWDIEIEDTKLTAVGSPTEVAFDLFDHADAHTLAVDGEGNKIIAPGTSGSFELTIENLAEVDAKYTIALAETNAGNIPLQYSLDEETWVDSVAELTMTGLTNQTLDREATANKTVYWRWVFDAELPEAEAHDGQTNIGDTTLGVAGSASVTITATITVEQVD